MLDVRFLAILLSAIGAGATTATAGPRTDQPMPVAERTLAPAGYTEMCHRVPQECLTNAAPTAQRMTLMREWANQARWAAVFSHSSASPRVETAAFDAYARPSSRLTQARPEVDPGLTESGLPRIAPLDAELAGAPATPFHTSGSGLEVSTKKVAIVPPLPTTLALRESILAAAIRADQDGARMTSRPVPTALSTRDLARINTLYNRSIRNASDAAVYGKADHWVAAQENRGRGDCEDYVLAKRKALIRAGVDPRALSIAIVKTRRGEMHAILLVQTLRGEVVLDNLSPWILSWRDAPYEWVSRQVAGSAVDWVSVDLG